MGLVEHARGRGGMFASAFLSLFRLSCMCSWILSLIAQ
jgi:hypothetical protein